MTDSITPEKREFDLQVTAAINAIITGKLGDIPGSLPTPLLMALLEMSNHLYKEIRDLKDQIRLLTKD